MSKKQNILTLYYEQNISIAKIADEVQVSRPYITKVIKTDERYISKKEKQKEETRQRKKAYTKNKMQKTREVKYREEALLKQQHIQATQELSGSKYTISNRAFKKCNSSIYRYNPKSKTYNLIRGINASKDVPKKIDWSGM